MNQQQRLICNLSTRHEAQLEHSCSLLSCGVADLSILKELATWGEAFTGRAGCRPEFLLMKVHSLAMHNFSKYCSLILTAFSSCVQHHPIDNIILSAASSYLQPHPICSLILSAASSYIQALSQIKPMFLPSMHLASVSTGCCSAAT